MTKEIHKSTTYILTCVYSVIAVALYCFWAFPYKAALSYREEMQLFQTTGSYFADFAGRPAGISVYIGEFLTQTFNNFWIGAAVLAFMMLLFLFLCHKITKKISPDSPQSITLILSLIILSTLWLFYGNADVTLGFLVALVFLLAASYCYISTKNDFTCLENYLRVIIATSLLYWVAGPVTIVFTLLIIVSQFLITSAGQNKSILNEICFGIFAIACIVANVGIWSKFITYPFSYQMIGIGYVMIPDLLTPGQVIVEALCVVVPIFALLLSKISISKKILVPTLILVEVVAIVLIYPKAYDKTAYRLIDYDYMVRAKDWDGILRYSDAHNPDLPLSVSATNLALGMTGQLDSRAFDYYQNGVEGLMPPFVKESLSSWTTGEIFFQLGMINSAQRFYFEGMEAIPNYNKSSRAVKRLAETAIIRGEYKLAEKYLHMLENTTFYQKWAQRNLQQIKDTATITPIYSMLRQRMVDEDYLFSEGELDKTLGQLFIKNPNNDVARQYLILYPLLQRDLNKFVQYMGVVAESHPKYNPLLAQQALAFISMKNGQTIPQNMVSPMVEQSLRGFAQAWTSKSPELIEPHRHTLYYYLISNE